MQNEKMNFSSMFFCSHFHFAHAIGKIVVISNCRAQIYKY